MIFKLGELFCGASGLAWGDVRRRTIGFVAMDAGAIRDIGKSELEVVIEGE